MQDQAIAIFKLDNKILQQARPQA